MSDFGVQLRDHLQSKEWELGHLLDIETLLDRIWDEMPDCLDEALTIADDLADQDVFSSTTGDSPR